jgi:flagellar hook-associated protein 1 FlgK
MGVPTLEGIQIALTGLLANQEALDVTGQNIANAQTPGYTRETALLTTRPSMSIAAIAPTNGGGAKLGTGVGVETITRIRNSFLDTQYRGASSALGNASTAAETLEQVQTALDEPTSTGLSAQLSTFWKAWNGLASVPTSAAAREAVVGAGQEVARTLNGLSEQITTTSNQAAKLYATLTGPGGEVQTDAERIAELNHQIKLSEQAGQPPNEMLDQRDALVDSLSKLGQVSVTEGEFGSITVNFGGAAKPLVEGTTVNWPQALTSAAGGQLGALLSLTEPEGKLAQLQGALNQVAEKLTESVNGFQPRAPFFKFTAGSAAATIAVAATPAQLQTGPEGEPGANNLAISIAGLRGGEGEQLYTSFVSQVGHEVQTARSIEANAEAVRTAVTSQRQTTSGVSLDEEMTKMMTFQRGYEASARVMTTMDAVLDTLINRTL